MKSKLALTTILLSIAITQEANAQNATNYVTIKDLSAILVWLGVITLIVMVVAIINRFNIFKQILENNNQ